jgi:archaellum component FlaC
VSENKVKVIIAGENQFAGVFNELNGNFATLKHAAESFLVGFGVERAVEALSELTMHVVDTEVEFGKMAQKTGTTVDALSGLAFAAKLNEVPVESMAKGLEKLSKAMLGLEDSPQAKGAGLALQKLGISVKDAAGNLKSSDTVFTEIAARFSRMKDGAEKTGLAMQIFGKAGAELIPVLNRGEEGLAALKEEAEKLGIVLTDESIANAEQFKETLIKLEATTDAAKRQFVAGLLPALTSTAEALLTLKVNAAGADESIAHMMGRWSASTLTFVRDSFLGIGYALNELKLQSDIHGGIPFWRKDEIAQARIDLMGLQDDYKKLMHVVEEKPKESIVSNLFGADWEKFDQAMKKINAANPFTPLTKAAKDLGDQIDPILDKFYKLTEQISFFGDVTAAALKKVEAHHAEMATLDQDIDMLQKRFKALKEFLDSHPGEYFPEVAKQAEDVKKKIEDLQKEKDKLEAEVKKTGESGVPQMPGGMTPQDVPINVPNGPLEKQAEKMKKIHDLWQQLGADIGDQVKQAALYGRSWGDVLKALIVDIGMAIIKFELLKHAEDDASDSSGSGGGGGFGGGIFGAILGGLFGKHASGGGVMAGMPYLVGENGPELFTSPASGSIVPNYMLGGGASAAGMGKLDVVLHVTSDVDLKIQKAMVRAANLGTAQAVNVIQERKLRTT